MDKITLSASPQIVLFKGFLSPEECAHLIEVAKTRLTTSTVISNQTGESVVDDYRTGSLAMLKAGEDDVIKAIEDRVAKATGTRIAQGEPVQVINYGPGERYKPHCDWIDPRIPQNEKHFKVGGQRAATVIMYLNTPTKGGKTNFPTAEKSVDAVAGDAVWFLNLDHGQPDPRVLHEGLPPDEGEKWIATRWIRERAFDGSEEVATPEQLEAQANKIRLENRNRCAEELKVIMKKYNCALRPYPTLGEDGIIKAKVDLVPL